MIIQFHILIMVKIGLIKKMKEKLPEDLIVAVSTGSTIAPENDPRPEVLQIGQTLTKAMSKLQ